MNRLVPVVLLLCAFGGGAAAEQSLVAVSNPEPGATRALLDAGLTVVRDMERYLLVVADEVELARLGDLGIRYEVLDPSMDGKTYYTATMRNASELPTLRSLVRVLRSDPFDAVIEATEEEALGAVAAGFEIARVFVRPIRLSRESDGGRLSKTMTADPFIQTMVDSVSGTLVDSYVQRLQDFKTRYCTTDSCQAAANWIKAKFESFGIDSVHFHAIGGNYKPNVVATIPGKGDPTKVVVLGGHYDSTSPSPTTNAPGADDNASGTACAIEAARVLASYDFNHTITFIAFGAEEVGLYGSEAYASDAAARGDDIIAAIAVDMIGYLASGDALDLDIIDNTGSVWIRDAAFQAAADYVPGFALVDGSLPGGASSDHASFWANGYDAILFFEDTGNYSPYIHTTNDLVGPSYNSPTLARNSVKTAVGLVATLAEPFRVGIVHTPLADTEDYTNPYRVVASISAAGALNADSLLVRYDAGSGFQTVPLAPTGNPEEYEGFIPAQMPGTFVSYYLVAEDTGGYRKTHPSTAPASVHRFFVGTVVTVIEDDFEIDRGWTAGVPGDNATTGIWERGDPQGTTSGGAQCQPEDDHTPAPGVNCYVTGRLAGSSAGSYDVDGGKTTLLSPAYDLSEYTIAFVSYWRWYTNSLGASPGEDYWRVQASDDGGTNWVYLENTTESRNSWTRYSFPLHEFIDLTSNVRFRFIAADEGSGSLVEAAVDDFAISIWDFSTAVAGAGDAAPKRPVLAQNVPNPFNPSTEIRFSVPAPGQKATLRVYDVAGREVRTLVQNEKISGSRSVTWNGTNEKGEPVGSGIYLYRLEVGGESLSRKLVLVR